MKLIVVLLVMLSKKLKVRIPWLHDDKWLGYCLEHLQKYGFYNQNNRPLQMLVLCLPIVLLTGFLYWLIGDWVYGFVGFVLSVLVVAFAMDFVVTDEEMEEYIALWRANKKDQYRQKAREYFALGTWGTRDEDLHFAVFARVVQRSCYSVFTPLLWYWVFGPMGAMISGLCAVIVRQGERRKRRAKDQMTRSSETILEPSVLDEELILFARQLQETLAWLPSRLMALSFSVTGHFSSVYKTAVNSFKLLDKSSQEVLNDCAGKALTLQPLLADREQMREQAARQMQGLQALLNRTLGFWLVIMAVFTIFGLTD